MNATILAERMAKAVARIEAETRRLGGELTLTPIRGDVAHQQLHTLEAIAAAMVGIDAVKDVEEPDVMEPPAPPDVEPVEAIISVVKEPAEKPAVKGKGKQ